MTANHQPQEYKWLYIFISLAAVVNFSGLFIPLMDPDAGVYASVSKNMVLRNNFLELYFRGSDWLDKPHFQFWITALFFKTFGIHDWAYKLPAVLFVMLGAVYTYLFAKRYYNKTIAFFSVFILLTAEHLIISNNDVRAEPFLVGLIMGAIWHFCNSINKKIGWHLLLASIFTACAVMTKGLFTLIPIAAAIAGDLIIKNEWHELFHWRWLVATVLIFLFITPELYCLWYQFDRHPEKVVYGKTSVSGIRFFLWDSQFGRFNDTGPIKGKGNITFFFHTLLWAFLPWSLIMYAALVDKVRSGFKKTSDLSAEWITISGSVATLLVFSISKFQLPHYTNIIFPLLAILTARYIWKIKDTKSSAFRIVQYAITVVLLSGGITIQLLYQPPVSFMVALIIAVIILLLVILPYWLKANSNLTAFYRTGLAAIAVNLYLLLAFYPDLLKYQSGNQAALFMNKNYPHEPAVSISIYAPALEFYLQDSLIITDTSSISLQNHQSNRIWFITEDELNLLKQKGIEFKILKEFPHFYVTRLSLKFLNKKTRQHELTSRFLVKFL
jgi:4-amino-4-deoxy-L-arabinose transferase-like glycosyltransferase